MDGKTVGFSVAIIILLVASVVGFYEYTTTSSSLSSIQSSYMNLQSQVAQQNKTIQSLNATLEMYKTQLSSAEGNASNYQKLYNMYLAMFQQAEQNYTMYKALYQALLQQQATGGASYKEGAALDTVFKFWDGIAIENPSDVTPFLSTNFSAQVEGVPFPGSYSFSTFNTTWLAQFFGNYETVYFYTTALPTVTSVNNNTYQVNAVVQYFVAPTNDPILLQVFNASVTLTVQFIQGQPLITKMVWMGNEVPPSAVIAGYPSQHSLAEWTVLSEFLSEVNGMGAEFPPSTIAQYFSPSATLQIEGQLPPVFKPGNYTGISNIESVFNTWDSYFIFALTYSQNLLPNGTAVPPGVKVVMNPTSPGTAMVVANVTPFFGFVNQGQPGFPNIYDLHIAMTTYFTYNATTSMWQITKQVWNVSEVPTLSDTMFYNLNTPTFKVIGEQTVTVNASKGAILQVGPVTTILRPGTYAELPSGNLSLLYNFSLILFSVQAVPSPAPDYNNLTPTYAFAFAINGQISPAYSLVNSSKGADPAITVVWAPDTWTSWTWFGGSFNGTTYVGGSYKFVDHWLYGNGVMVNLQFFKPVLWVFEAGMTPQGTPAPASTVMQSTVYGLTPVNAYSEVINSQQGGVIVAGDMVVVVQPGTTISTPVGILNQYNFSVVFYDPQNVTSPAPGQVPFLVFAYAVNGNVTFSYTASKPFITIIMTPSQGAQMWTWGSRNGMNTYVFHDPILVGNGIVINLSFLKPVPWVLTLPEMVSIPSSGTSSGGYGGYY